MNIRMYVWGHRELLETPTFSKLYYDSRGCQPVTCNAHYSDMKVFAIQYQQIATIKCGEKERSSNLLESKKRMTNEKCFGALKALEIYGKHIWLANIIPELDAD